MLTVRQKEVFDFVKSYIKKNSYSPTFEEIAKNFRLKSLGTVQEHLQKIEKKGQIKLNRNHKRGIEIVESVPMIQVPLLGTIAAGRPLTLFDVPSETIAVPKNKIPPSSEIYALRVEGESMIEEGVKDGDIILVRHQRTAENGQKVVALIDNSEATLKKFYKERGHIRLQSANKNFEPIIIKRGERDIKIQGILIDVIRSNETEQPVNTFVLSSKKSEKQRGKISDYVNKVYNGDVMNVLRDLPDNSIDMIFGDPDYNVGVRYGENNYKKKFDDYINWYIELTRESMRVLKKDGNFFTMNYPQQNAHLRVKYLDSHFPNINEYVWVYNTNVGHTPKRFTTAHRSILHVRKNAKNKFFKNAVALPYKNPNDRRIKRNLANGSAGRMPYSWLEFNLVKNVSKEKTYHACQIPQKLTEVLIKASTRPKNVVFVLFGGSGAEIDVCKKLNRRFISAEIDKNYCNIINDRLANGYITPKYKLIRGRKRI